MHLCCIERPARLADAVFAHKRRVIEMILLGIQVILKYVFDKKQNRMSLERTESTQHCMQSIRGQPNAVSLNG